MKIIPHLDSIVELVRSNEVTTIEAATGSGKSIMLPGTIAIRLEKKVFISVPRVTSAKTLTSFASRVFEGKGITFGYGAEGKKEYRDHDNVVYATSGHLRRKILNYAKDGQFNDIDFCDLLVIDEMHTGSVDNDTIMSYLMVAKSQGKKIPNVMFLSATPVENFYEPKPVIFHLDIQHPYPIDLIYHDISFGPSDYEKIYEETVSVVSKIPKEDGDILVFVHGKRPADEMASHLSKIMRDDMILTAYSGMKSEDFDLIYEPSEKRKIIIATNVVEASITIDGLGVIVDTLLENTASTSSTGGLKLTVTRICKDSARQRLGRTGRTRKGKCIRMISSGLYNHLDDHVVPEIQRVPINEVVMEFISRGLDPKKDLKGVNPSKVQDSINLLTELGAIVDGTVTDLGNFLPTIPLGVRNGALLYHWIKSGYPIFPGMVAVAILDAYQSPGYFYVPKRGQNEDPISYSERLSDFFDLKVGPYKGQTQLHTYLKLWNDFSRLVGRDLFYIIKTGDVFGHNRALFRDWGNANSVNQKKFRELLVVLRQLYNNVDRIQSTASKRVGTFNPLQVAENIIELLPKCYGGNLISLTYGHNYLHMKTRTTHILETRSVFSELEEGDNPKHLLAISTVQIRNKTIVSLALPYYEKKEE